MPSSGSQDIFVVHLSTRPTDKKRAGRATDRVGAGARDHAADHIAPAWEKFQDRPAPSRKKHSCANICPDAVINSVAARRFVLDR